MIIAAILANQAKWIPGSYMVQKRVIPEQLKSLFVRSVELCPINNDENDIMNKKCTTINDRKDQNRDDKMTSDNNKKRDDYRNQHVNDDVGRDSAKIRDGPGRRVTGLWDPSTTSR